MNHRIAYQYLLLISMLFLSCALTQQSLNQELIKSTINDLYTLEKEVLINPMNASSLKLKAGTLWRHLGSIEEGEVYTTKDQAVILNGFNVYEGYIVVLDKTLVGFYLPTEGTFVDSKPKEIILNLKGEN